MNLRSFLCFFCLFLVGLTAESSGTPKDFQNDLKNTAEEGGKNGGTGDGSINRLADRPAAGASTTAPPENVTSQIISLVKDGRWTILLAILLYVGRDRVSEAVAVVIDKVKQGWKISVAGFALEPPPTLSSETSDIVLPKRAAPLTDEVGSDALEVVSPAEADILEKMKTKTYPYPVSEEIYLMHAAKVVRPRKRQQNGWYQVGVWVEFEKPMEAEEAIRVTYRLHDSFKSIVPDGVVSTRDRSGTQKFIMWMTVYGEFTVVACVERRGKDPLYLYRYLDLPDRPPE